MRWLFFLFFTYTTLLQAQTGYTAGVMNVFKTVSTPSTSGSVVIVQDAKLADLFNKSVALKAKDKKIPGYRIRIYSDLGTKARDQSLDAQTKFLSVFPDVPVYRSYNQPYFKVYVGDFRTRYEAHRFLKQLQPHFKSAFPVKTEINLPDLSQ